MIRRLFWLVLGAALGIAGYRRAAALTRALRPAPRPGKLTGFSADVREGMALYLERQAARAPSNLESHTRRGLPRASGRDPSRTDELKDGR